MGSNCCSGDQKKKEAEAIEKRSNQVRSQLGSQNYGQDRFKASYQYIANKKKLANYLHQLGQGSDKVQQFYKRLKAKNYENYHQLCLYLTTTNVDLKINQKLNNVSKQFGVLDRYTMILLGLDTIQEYQNYKLDQSTLQHLMFSYFGIYSPELKSNNLKILSDYIKEHTEKCKTVPQFTKVFQSQFLLYQKTLISYFIAKFVSQSNNEYCFKSIPKSDILKVQHWISLHLQQHNIFKNTPKILYSAIKDGSSFSTLTQKIVGYTGPWILVLSHIENHKIEEKKQMYIIGTYQNAPIQDILDYQGTPDSFIFRLHPTLRFFTVSDGEGASNYFLINTISSDVKQLRRGIGFGGQNKIDYKLWIDQNIDNQSQVGGVHDPTYGNGCLAFPGTTKLSIRDFQIWALGNQQNIKDRNNYQKVKQQQATKARTVNKKDFFSGGAVPFILQQTFKHREQMRGTLSNKQSESANKRSSQVKEQNNIPGTETKQKSIVEDIPHQPQATQTPQTTNSTKNKEEENTKNDKTNS